MGVLPKILKESGHVTGHFILRGEPSKVNNTSTISKPTGSINMNTGRRRVTGRIMGKKSKRITNPVYGGLK